MPNQFTQTRKGLADVCFYPNVQCRVHISKELFCRNNENNETEFIVILKFEFEKVIFSTVEEKLFML
jgi:hypothetical protein